MKHFKDDDLPPKEDQDVATQQTDESAEKPRGGCPT